MQNIYIINNKVNIIKKNFSAIFAPFSGILILSSAFSFPFSFGVTLWTFFSFSYVLFTSSSFGSSTFKGKTLTENWPK